MGSSSPAPAAAGMAASTPVAAPVTTTVAPPPPAPMPAMQVAAPAYQTGINGNGIGLGANTKMPGQPWDWQAGMKAGMPLIQGGLDPKNGDAKAVPMGMQIQAPQYQGGGYGYQMPQSVFRV